MVYSVLHIFCSHLPLLLIFRLVQTLFSFYIQDYFVVCNLSVYLSTHLSTCLTCGHVITGIWASLVATCLEVQVTSPTCLAQPSPAGMKPFPSPPLPHSFLRSFVTSFIPPSFPFLLRSSLPLFVNSLLLSFFLFFILLFPP